MEFLFKKNFHPHIVHLHDWPTAVVAPLMREMYSSLGFNDVKVVFTVHNFDYQGRCSVDNLESIGMKGNHYLHRNRLQDDNDPHLINLVKGGIVYSDYVTTVSPAYAREVTVPPGGKGLEKTLIKYQSKFSGILNGIDYSYWNPEIDRYLPMHYSSREKPIDKKDSLTLDKKAFVKNFVREKFLLAEQHRPIVCSVTRLVAQKGTELIKHALEYTLEHGGQFILLGSCPDPIIAKDFHQLKHHYADHPHVFISLHVQEELSHIIYAGADIIVVPSIFEPCGLTQMIALKYGTIPVVRRTGGLADTIFDVDSDHQGKGNGYTFDNPDTESFDGALGRAIHCWYHQPERWRKLVVHGMNIDFSWNLPADEYVDVYTSLIHR